MFSVELVACLCKQGWTGRRQLSTTRWPLLTGAWLPVGLCRQCWTGRRWPPTGRRSLLRVSIWHPAFRSTFQLSVLLGQLYKPRDDCLGNTQDNPATTFIRCFARSDELNPGYDISGTSQLAIYGIYLTLNDWKWKVDVYVFLWTLTSHSARHFTCFGRLTSLSISLSIGVWCV
jgi:hypothetical protein